MKNSAGLNRIGRATFFVSSIVAFVAWFVFATLFLLLLSLFIPISFEEGDWRGPIMVYILFIPYLVYAVRLYILRLHDLNQPGALVLLAFVPFASLILWIWLQFASGTEGENKYGPEPKGGTLVYPRIW